jgi:hypothetical protein
MERARTVDNVVGSGAGRVALAASDRKRRRVARGGGCTQARLRARGMPSEAVEVH